MPTGALLPIVLDLAPQLSAWLFGSFGSRAVELIAKAALQVTGAMDGPAQAQLLADPDKRQAFRIELARIHATLFEERRQADMTEIQARLAEAPTLVLPSSYSATSWGAPVVSIVVLMTFGAMLACLLTWPIPDSALALANVMLGSLGSMAAGVVQYWTGSSAGSRAKDQELARVHQQQLTLTTAK